MVCQSDLLPITTATLWGGSVVICQLFYSFSIYCIPLPTNVLHYYLTFLLSASYARDPFLPAPSRPQGIELLGLTCGVEARAKGTGKGFNEKLSVGFGVGL